VVIFTSGFFSSKSWALIPTAIQLVWTWWWKELELQLSIPLLITILHPLTFLDLRFSVF
jgi:hypothetical protein